MVEDLEMEHVNLQIHVKDISRDTAEFLVARRINIVKDRNTIVR